MLDEKLYRPAEKQDIPFPMSKKVAALFPKLKDFLGRGLSQMQMIEQTGKFLLETVFDLHEISEQELLDTSTAIVIQLTGLMNIGAEMRPVDQQMTTHKDEFKFICRNMKSKRYRDVHFG